VFLCMLTYHVEWHLRQALTALLFHDADLAKAPDRAASPIVSTESSKTANAKKASKRKAEGLGDALRRTDGSPRHADPQYNARITTGQSPIHPVRDTNADPGGCLQTARPRTHACPIDKEPRDALSAGNQSFMQCQTENLGLNTTYVAGDVGIQLSNYLIVDLRRKIRVVLVAA
jgi:hypothetical protein